jgi:hypothetical protein
MPYVSAAERQRQRWMTLKEALSHIQRVEKLDENAALHHLRLALAEGAVGATWAMSEALLQKAGDSLTSGIQIIDEAVRGAFWLNVRVNLEVGTLEFETRDLIDRDKQPPYGPRRATKRVVQSDRVVWVLKESICKYWKDEEPEEPESTGQPQPQASDDDIIWAIREVFKEIGEGKITHRDKNTIHHEVDKKVSPKRAPRKVVFNLMETTPEFALQRLDVGRPTKKKLKSLSRGK